MPPIRFGASLPLHAPQEQFAIARRVDALGFDSVWTGDHVSFHTPLYESLTLLASYAGITSRVKLGAGVYLSPTCAAANEAEQLETYAAELFPKFRGA